MVGIKRMDQHTLDVCGGDEEHGWVGAVCREFWFRLWTRAGGLLKSARPGRIGVEYAKYLCVFNNVL